MTKFLLLSAFCALFATSYAQVGINTSTPKATLDIAASPSNNFADGVILPRLSKAQLANKLQGTYGPDQDGLMVYINDVDTAFPVNAPSKDLVEYIKEKGVYSYSGGFWQSVVTAVPVINGKMEPVASEFINLNRSNRLNLKSYIELLPGRWEVEIYVILEAKEASTQTNYPNSYNWVKLSFTERPESDLGGVVTTSTNLSPVSDDVVSSSKLISGSVTTFDGIRTNAGNYYGVVNGTVLIENKTQNKKKYYLYYDSSIYTSGSMRMVNLGGNAHLENFIVARRIQ